MLTESEITIAVDSAIQMYCNDLHVNKCRINPIAILKAIAKMESNYGKMYAASLHESAFCYGGYYYKRSEDLRRLSKIWGCNAHSSHGVWQLLYITAYELGFRDDPIRLREPNVCCDYAVRLLNRRVADRLDDEVPQDLFDAFNSGTPRDNRVPHKYINRAMEYYGEYK